MDWFKEHILRILRFSESSYTVGGSCELESVYVNMCLVFAMENGGFTGYWFTVLVLLVENRSFTFFQWVYWLQFSFNPSNDFGTKWSPMKWSTVVVGFQPFQPFQPHPWTAFVLGCDPGWVSATWCHMFISDIPCLASGSHRKSNCTPCHGPVEVCEPCGSQLEQTASFTVHTLAQHRLAMLW